MLWAMEHGFWQPVAEIFTLLGAALVLGVVFERLKQSAILGYLLAGTLLGPGALSWVGGGEVVNATAELGVALLLFAIGLEFSLKRLVRIGPIGLGGGSVQVALTLGAAAGIAMLMGLTGKTSIAIGAMVALSSTACVLRVLSDRAEIDSIHGRNALGILLLQDIAVVPLVLIVGMLGAPGNGIEGESASGANLAVEFIKKIVLIVVMVGGFYLISNYVLAPILKTSALLRNHELLVLLAVVLALGAALAAHELGISPALGAFLAGMMLAESPFAVQVRSDIGALRTLFVTLFFASIGMLADVAWLAGHIPLVAGVVAVLILGKAIVITGVVVMFRHRIAHAVATGLCLAQVGEFSFVIVEVARSGGVIDEQVFRVMVSATLISLFVTPFTVALAPLAGRWAQRWFGRADPVGEAGIAERARLADHVVLIGFGPAGQRVAEVLARSKTPAVVIDLHPRNITLARGMGLIGQVGDGSSAEVLHHIDLHAARLVVITLPDRRAVTNIVQRVGAIAPNVPIIARARYHAFVREIELSGAQVVIDEEQQIGRRISLEVRRVLARPPGAPPEKVTGHEQALWRTSD